MLATPLKRASLYGGGPRTSTEYGGRPQAFTIGRQCLQPASGRLSTIMAEAPVLLPSTAGGPKLLPLAPANGNRASSLAASTRCHDAAVLNASSILAGATRAREGVGAAALAAGLAYLQTRKRIGCQHSGIPNAMTHGVREAGRLSPSDAGSRRAPPPLFARTPLLFLLSLASKRKSSIWPNKKFRMPADTHARHTSVSARALGSRARRQRWREDDGAHLKLRPD
jgi:hypothetical protein